MSTAATRPMAAIPPRPSRSLEKDGSSRSTPMVPPRPAKGRSVSPNPDRFAPSPLNENPFLPRSPAKYVTSAPDLLRNGGDPVDRSGSVTMPSLGEEGCEYAAVTEELEEENRHASPEQTRTVGEDVQMHAPMPSLPATSNTQRIMTVTRTDSDRAAAFGIGKPSVSGSELGLRRAKSTSSHGSGDSHAHHSCAEDEHGIPEIGLQVPMCPNAGDVQAPSPGPSASGIADAVREQRAATSRGLPPGSYGMHGHGIVSRDELDKVYYEKHPEQYKMEHAVRPHDRPHDFALSSEDLNRIVRDTANRGSGLGTHEFAGTPSEEIGFQATEEYASRMATPHTQPDPAKIHPPRASPKIFAPPPNDDVIHIDEHKRGFASPDDHGSEKGDDKHNYSAPILAPDEVDANAAAMQPAVEPPPERSGSAFEMEEPRNPPRPITVSRPSSLHNVEFASTGPPPHEEEYEPLFDDDAKPQEQPVAHQKDHHNHNHHTLHNLHNHHHHTHHFPSKDVWEDAPNSAHHTAVVSTPELPEDFEQKKCPPDRQIAETPAHAFARQQEKLAEEESRAGGVEGFFKRDHHKPVSAPLPAIAQFQRPGMSQRFPSRDVWEDVPESHLQQTTVSGPQQKEEPQDNEPHAPPARPAADRKQPPELAAAEKPLVPSRPKPRNLAGEEHAQQQPAKPAPPTADKPKPQVPQRPSKVASSAHAAAAAPAEEAAHAKSKPPAVPARLVGGKIAALQAGFMSDLNRRLQLGPQVPKKEEPSPAAEVAEEAEERAPLSDARKGRTRGPQRRAPGRNPAPAPAAAAGAAGGAGDTSEPAEAKRPLPLLSFTAPAKAWSIDPEDGSVGVEGKEKDAEKSTESEPVEKKGGSTSGEENTEKKEGDGEDDVKGEQKDVRKKDEKEAKVDAEPENVETKTIASNMAGEAVVEAKIVKEGGAEDKVEPVDVEEVVKP